MLRERVERFVLRQYWRTIFRMARKRKELDIRIGYLLPSNEHDHLYRRIGQALALLQRYDPRALTRMRALSDGILVLGTTGALAEWHGDARLIRVSEQHAADEAVSDLQLAATLVHETTHAWLEHYGIRARYRDGVERRARVEAVCYRSEAAFLRRTPDGEVLARDLECLAAWALEEPESKWSKEAANGRRADALRELGVPEWLIRRATSIAGTADTRSAA
jgi:hypothetical protein